MTSVVSRAIHPATPPIRNAAVAAAAASVRQLRFERSNVSTFKCAGTASLAALAKRVQALLGGKVPVTSADLAREIALQADKLDVSEELARLASHLDQLERFVAKGGRVGRQLDFLAQEIFREVNTIGSKCSDATVAHWVVEAKTHVERLREQVQNVE